MNVQTELDWEQIWAPYDESTYRQVLSGVSAGDVVLDIGAGDLRLAKRLARRVRHVFAIEINLALAARGRPLPPNLTLIGGDARTTPFPKGLTAGVLLMRHCRHLSLYATKLRHAGGKRLLTNARWRFGVESIDLFCERIPFSQLTFGWYACWCGHTGFAPGPPEQLTSIIEESIYEVEDCPACATPSPLA